MPMTLFFIQFVVGLHCFCKRILSECLKKNSWSWVMWVTVHHLYSASTQYTSHYLFPQYHKSRNNLFCCFLLWSAWYGHFAPFVLFSTLIDISICYSRILLLLLEPILSILHHAKVMTNRLDSDYLGFDFGHLNRLYTGDCLYYNRR